MLEIDENEYWDDHDEDPGNEDEPESSYRSRADYDEQDEEFLDAEGMEGFYIEDELDRYRDKLGFDEAELDLHNALGQDPNDGEVDEAEYNDAEDDESELANTGVASEPSELVENEPPSEASEEHPDAPLHRSGREKEPESARPRHREQYTHILDQISREEAAQKEAAKILYDRAFGEKEILRQHRPKQYAYIFDKMDREEAIRAQNARILYETAFGNEPPVSTESLPIAQNARVSTEHPPTLAPHQKTKADCRNVAVNFACIPERLANMPSDFQAYIQSIADGSFDFSQFRTDTPTLYVNQMKIAHHTLSKDAMAENFRQSGWIQEIQSTDTTMTRHPYVQNLIHHTNALFEQGIENHDGVLKSILHMFADTVAIEAPISDSRFFLNGYIDLLAVISKGNGQYQIYVGDYKPDAEIRRNPSNHLTSIPQVALYGAMLRKQLNFPDYVDICCFSFNDRSAWVYPVEILDVLHTAVDLDTQPRQEWLEPWTLFNRNALQPGDPAPEITKHLQQIIAQQGKKKTKIPEDARIIDTNGRIAIDETRYYINKDYQGNAIYFRKTETMLELYNDPEKTDLLARLTLDPVTHKSSGIEFFSIPQNIAKPILEKTPPDPAELTLKKSPFNENFRKIDTMGRISWFSNEYSIGARFIGLTVKIKEENDTLFIYDALNEERLIKKIKLDTETRFPLNYFRRTLDNKGRLNWKGAEILVEKHFAKVHVWIRDNIEKNLISIFLDENRTKLLAEIEIRPKTQEIRSKKFYLDWENTNPINPSYNLRYRRIVNSEGYIQIRHKHWYIGENYANQFISYKNNRYFIEIFTDNGTFIKKIQKKEIKHAFPKKTSNQPIDSYIQNINETQLKPQINEKKLQQIQNTSELEPPNPSSESSELQLYQTERKIKKLKKMELVNRRKTHLIKAESICQKFERPIWGINLFSWQGAAFRLPLGIRLEHIYVKITPIGLETYADPDYRQLISVFRFDSAMLRRRAPKHYEVLETRLVDTQHRFIFATKIFKLPPAYTGRMIQTIYANNSLNVYASEDLNTPIACFPYIGDPHLQIACPNARFVDHNCRIRWNEHKIRVPRQCINHQVFLFEEGDYLAIYTNIERTQLIRKYLLKNKP
jgi:hypothetical protein